MAVQRAVGRRAERPLERREVAVVEHELLEVGERKRHRAVALRRVGEGALGEAAERRARRQRGFGGANAAVGAPIVAEPELALPNSNTRVYHAHDDGVVYSSTRIRSCLEVGNVRGAAAILGRHFSYEGRVSHGNQRGRTINFPTLNLHLGSTLRPALGVYAVRVGILDGNETVWRNGVANVGKRPTFGGKDVILEAHVMDFSGNLYGKLIAVELIDFIRAEKKFDGLEALRAQIAADTDMARNILAPEPT